MNLPRSRKDIFLQTLLPAFVLVLAAGLWFIGIPGLPVQLKQAACIVLALLAVSYWALCLVWWPADPYHRRVAALIGALCILGTMVCAAFFLLPVACAAVLAIFLFLDIRTMRGYPPDGRNWPDLLQHCALPIQILDRYGSVVYASACAKPLEQRHLDAIYYGGAATGVTEYNKDIQLYNRMFFPGVTVIQKDRRRIHTLEAELESLREEMKNMQAWIAQTDALEAGLEELRARNAFLATQESVIREKAPGIGLLLHCAAAPNPEPGFRRMTVTRANLLICELYQLGLLLQACGETNRLTAADLVAVLEGMTGAAAEAGVRCRIYQVAQGVYPADKVMEAFRLLCRFLEQLIIADLGSMDIRLRNEQNALRMLLTAPGGKAELAEAALTKETTLKTAIRETVDGVTLTVEFEFAGGGEDDA